MYETFFSNSHFLIFLFFVFLKKISSENFSHVHDMLRARPVGGGEAVGELEVGTAVQVKGLSWEAGADTWWYYVESGPVDTVSMVFFMILIGVGGLFQSSLLGLFFLMGGYFTPRSHDRKGVSAFWRERLRRLGIPLLLYTRVTVTSIKRKRKIGMTIKNRVRTEAINLSEELRNGNRYPV